MNFLDPVTTTDGKPFGPVRYKQICREMYLISKNTHISIEDIKKMTPLERNYFLEFIEADAMRAKEQIDKMQNKQTNTRTY